jgi:hypothetical protein
MMGRKAYEDLIAELLGCDLLQDLTAELLYRWRDEYLDNHGDAELLIVKGGPNETGFSYLFDFARQRNVVAFGTPTANDEKRDSTRMAGHPLSSGSEYHRGHLIAHSLGGGTDINLLPQLASVNVGAFRSIERVAKATISEGMSCLYFVRALYADDTSQVPSHLEQCLVLASGVFYYAIHDNLPSASL